MNKSIQRKCQRYFLEYGKQVYKCYCSTSSTRSKPVKPTLPDQPPWKVLFFGSDEFSLHSLKALEQQRHSKLHPLVGELEVVTANKKTPVNKFAAETGLRVHQWSTLGDEHQAFDVGVLSSFGKLIPSRIIDIFAAGILNIHPSLLPRWRGATPIEHTILYGDTTAGVSIMNLKPRHFDLGPLISQKEVPVPDNCTTQQLHELLAPLGTTMLMDALRKLPRLGEMEFNQSVSGVTYAHKFSQYKSTLIDWEQSTVKEIDTQYKALHRMVLRTEYKNQTLKLWDLCTMDDIQEEELDQRASQIYNEVLPGSLLYIKQHKCLAFKCKDGWVGFRSLKFPAAGSPAGFNGSHLTKLGCELHRCTSHRNNLYNLGNMTSDKILVTS